jgi:restriction endonuclease S subunit
MKLKEISDIHSGYITRKKIVAASDGSHYLVQAKNVDGNQLSYETQEMIRFHPTLSRKDLPLEKGDLLFMARGAHNFSILMGDLPEPTLAAACFFIIRVSGPEILPGYLGWYLNQAPVEHYLLAHSGRSVHMPVVRRAVLENIQVPVPTLDRQAKIADLNTLMLKEMTLLQQLGRKRKELITAACLQTINDQLTMGLHQ